jgi:DNA-binding LacI/PurR family transcriptional regulator
MEKVVSHLYSLGHRRLGFLGHHPTLGPLNERVKAVRDAANRYPDLRVTTAADTDTLEGGRNAARALLDSRPRPTAIVCVNDLMAVGALRELRARGLRVPEDVSVTGFDNVTLAQFCHPALTSVHIPRDQIGETICASLIDREKAPPEHELVIEPELLLRDSTGRAPTDRA